MTDKITRKTIGREKRCVDSKNGNVKKNEKEKNTPGNQEMNRAHAIKREKTQTQTPTHTKKSTTKW
jgi:hypothetical protein